MTDVTLSRELVERAALALENSADMVRTDYETNWRHGIPTRAAQLDSLRRSVEAHESALADLRSALSQPHTERAGVATWLPLLGALVCEAKSDSYGREERERRIDAAHKALFDCLTRPATPPSPSEEPARCRYCDGTGDVHGPDGEWRGACTECDAAATGYATRLAEAIHAKHYSHVTQWKPLPDLMGLLTQIDNMTAGLAAAPTPAAGGLTAEIIEQLAIEHEDFGFGKVDAHGITTHGFSGEGLRNFVAALLAKIGGGRG